MIFLRSHHLHDEVTTTFKEVLLQHPVWILSTTWRDLRTFIFDSLLGPLDYLWLVRGYIFISENCQNVSARGRFDSVAFCPASPPPIWIVVITLLTSSNLFLSSFRCVCNIDCSQTNFNPLCASDGKSYDNACQIKEASCQKQEKIEVMSLGRCQGTVRSEISSQRMFLVSVQKWKGEASSLLGSYFRSERQFWFTMARVASCRICVDYRCLRAHKQKCMSFSV